MTQVQPSNRSKQQQPTHTPGPWRIFMTANQVPIITSDCGDVASTRANGNNAGGIEEANARLIAAAPELLAALKLIRRIGGGLIDGEKSAAEALAKCFAEAGEAIVKAEGR